MTSLTARLELTKCRVLGSPSLFAHDDLKWPDLARKDELEEIDYAEDEGDIVTGPREVEEIEDDYGDIAGVGGIQERT